MAKEEEIKLPSLKEIDAMAMGIPRDHECTALCHDLLFTLELLASVTGIEKLRLLARLRAIKARMRELKCALCLPDDPGSFDTNASTADTLVQLSSVDKRPGSCEDQLKAIGALEDHIADLVAVFQESGRPSKIGQMIQRLEGVLASLKKVATSSGCLR
jgi:hypothetical protein